MRCMWWIVTNIMSGHGHHEQNYIPQAQTISSVSGQAPIPPTAPQHGQEYYTNRVSSWWWGGWSWSIDHDHDGDGDDYKRTIRFSRNNVKTPICITIKLEMSTVAVIVTTKAIVVIITYVILIPIHCKCQHFQKVDTLNSTILCELSQEQLNDDSRVIVIIILLSSFH